MCTCAYLSGGNTLVSLTRGSAPLLSIKPCRVIFPCLGQLRVNNDLAIALLRELGVVVLVNVLRRIEHGKPADLSHNRPGPQGLVAFDRLLEEDLLLGRLIEHGRAVLGADVVALAVERSGI